MLRRDWIAPLASLLVLSWTVLEWRHYGRRVAVLQDALTTAEQQYRTTLRRIKRNTERHKRWQADIQQMQTENAQLQAQLGAAQQQADNHTATTAATTHNSIIPLHTEFVPHETHDESILQKYQEAEAMEQVYLTRISELQDSIRQWNLKTTQEEYKHRFPLFAFTCRIQWGDADDTGLDTETITTFQLRFTNINNFFPVELHSLTDLVKQNQWDGLQLHFTPTLEATQINQTVLDSGSTIMMNLTRLVPPHNHDHWPTWPTRHNISLKLQFRSWFIETTYRPTVLDPLETHSMAQIVDGSDILQRWAVRLMKTGKARAQPITLHVISVERLPLS